MPRLEYVNSCAVVVASYVRRATGVINSVLFQDAMKIGKEKGKNGKDGEMVDEVRLYRLFYTFLPTDRRDSIKSVFKSSMSLVIVYLFAIIILLSFHPHLSKVSII